MDNFQTKCVQGQLLNPGKETKEICIEVKNPFSIDLISNVIFDFLEPQDLKKCRQVCKLWSSSVVSSPAWRRWAKVNIITYEQSQRTIEDFLNLVEHGNGTCVSEIYDIKGYMIPPEPFWSLCEDWIKTLRLYNVRFESEDDFRTVVYKACPNMEQLELYFVHVRRFESEGKVMEPTSYREPQFGEQRKLKALALVSSYEGYGVSWMEILSHFPSLESLRLQGEGFQGLFISFNKIRLKFPAKLKLKHITAHSADDPYPEIFHILKDKGLQLQTIDTGKLGSLEDLQKILEIHASSLKKLASTCSLNGPRYDPYQIFPLRSAQTCSVQLDALQEFVLVGEVFVSLAILKFIPNLRILKIGDLANEVISNTSLTEMEEVSLEWCKKLTVDSALSLDSLRKLITWLPNVQMLEFKRLTNAHFRMICESWTGLVAFVSNWGRVDDMGITGLDEKDVRMINELGELSSWRPITVPRANISSLKDLKSLYMQGYGGHIPAVELGHCAAVCGVEQLPKLEQLHLTRYILKTSIRKRLQFRFPNVTIDDWMISHLPTGM